MVSSPKGHDLPALVLEAQTSLPTDHGVFTARAYTCEGVTHVAMIFGDPTVADLLVRLHSECLTGDALGSHRCDCGDQLTAAQEAIAIGGNGVLLYLRGHEGRGIGLANKLRAYALQDGGLDTLDANRALDLPDDARDYRVAAAILADLGCRSVRLLSANPAKAEALEQLGFTVTERLALPVPDRPENSRYLRTKRQRMRHDAHAVQPLPELPVYRTLARHSEVVAQLAQSADGFIAARGGDAQFVSGEKDRTHLHQLRAAVDAVLVGANTVVSDNPQLTVRTVAGTNPLRVLLDPHARLPVESNVLQSAQAATLWLVGPEAEVPTGLGDHVDVARLPAAGAGVRVDPTAVIALIRQRVTGSILVEGGGKTVSDFLSAGVLDRLFLTVAPVLIGDGVPGVRFHGSSIMSQALRAPFRRYKFGEDICTEFVLSEAAQHHSGQHLAQGAAGS